jgi:hypothetical protein
MNMEETGYLLGTYLCRAALLCLPSPPPHPPSELWCDAELDACHAARDGVQAGLKRHAGERVQAATDLVTCSTAGGSQAHTTAESALPT